MLLKHKLKIGKIDFIDPITTSSAPAVIQTAHLCQTHSCFLTFNFFNLSSTQKLCILHIMHTNFITIFNKCNYFSISQFILFITCECSNCSSHSFHALPDRTCLQLHTENLHTGKTRCSTRSN